MGVIIVFLIWYILGMRERELISNRKFVYLIILVKGFFFIEQILYFDEVIYLMVMRRFSVFFDWQFYFKYFLDIDNYMCQVLFFKFDKY